MMGLTVKNIIIKKQLKKKFKVPGDLFVLFSTVFVLERETLESSTAAKKTRHLLKYNHI
jgi:hypothetical protein